MRMITVAPGDKTPIGGLKVIAENGWFAARPSGTEQIYKIYAESFKGREHLERVISEAKEIVKDTFCALEKDKGNDATGEMNIYMRLCRFTHQ